MCLFIFFSNLIRLFACVDLLSGANVGETIAAIIHMQLQAVRDSDRFWFEGPTFLPNETAMIYNTSLQTLLLRNLNVTSVNPLSVFPTAPFFLPEAALGSFCMPSLFLFSSVLFFCLCYSLCVSYFYHTTPNPHTQIRVPLRSPVAATITAFCSRRPTCFRGRSSARRGPSRWSCARR